MRYLIFMPPGRKFLDNAPRCLLYNKSAFGSSFPLRYDQGCVSLAAPLFVYGGT
jgi:hypothetical protein